MIYLYALLTIGFLFGVWCAGDDEAGVIRTVAIGALGSILMPFMILGVLLDELDSLRSGRPWGFTKAEIKRFLW